ncbi:MAG: hypothetical protein HZB23_01555 [Deltaproteobacteria bacterium]|nr:hypothetical protein [Deltaproteobacteria bacterium]
MKNHGVSILVTALFIGLATLFWGFDGALAAKKAGVQAPQKAMKKFVTKDAGFVLYMPAGWSAAEESIKDGRRLSVADPQKSFSAEMTVGNLGQGALAADAARLCLSPFRKRHPDLDFPGGIFTSDAGRRLHFSGAYASGKKGRREIRGWVSTGPDGGFVFSAIEGPFGKLEGKRQELLTILSNVRVMKAASGPARGTAQMAELRSHRMSDGSASFMIPSNWQVTEFGAGCFLAKDPTDSRHFLVASAEVLSPSLGVRVPNTPVSPYLPPHRAMEFLLGFQRLAYGVKFLEVNQRPEIVREMSSQYTVGPVLVEDFRYTCTSARGDRRKAFTFGVSFGSRMNTGWRFFHMSVFAPENEFDSFVPTFIKMLESYRINDQFARSYIAAGMARLREMEKETARKVSRNAAEIREMMQAAYDERQRSQDYIDYQRTGYIRGQMDWVSEAEGGQVYHTDSWGTQNTATGEYYQGAPYDYVNFSGRNPKYNEDMQPINSRELWERHAR